MRDLAVEGTTVRLYAQRRGGRAARAAPAARPGGLPVRSLRLSEPSLDDVFLRQTGRSLRDAGGPAVPAADREAEAAA